MDVAPGTDRVPGPPRTLKKRRSFLAAAKARKWVTPGVILQAVEQSRTEPAEGPAPRIGFTASRKVGGAVERNRAKRRLRAAARSVLADHARTGFDYVLIGREATLTRRFDDLLEDLRSGLIHIHERKAQTRRRKRTGPDLPTA